MRRGRRYSGASSDPANEAVMLISLVVALACAFIAVALMGA